MRFSVKSKHLTVVKLVFLSHEKEKIKTVIGEAAGKSAICCESLSFLPLYLAVKGLCYHITVSLSLSLKKKECKGE